MAILKIRDADGNVKEIIALKGDKGDKGEDYVLTDADKEEIADLIIEKLSVYSGEMEDV